MPGNLSGSLKGGLLAATVFIVCWGGAIWYWRGAEGTPGTVELALVLLALPLALAGSLSFGARLLAQRTKAAPAATANPAPAVVAATTPLPALAIVSTALRSPHGASAEELANALASKQPRPDLDAELVDDAGFPVLAARCKEAADAALRDEVSSWLLQSGMPDLHWRDEDWRALVLGSAVVAELASRAGDLLAAQGQPPLLRLLPLLPADWSSAQRRAASLWFAHLTASRGWPAAQLTLGRELELDDAMPAAASTLFTGLARDAANGGTPLAALIVACASYIGQETVDAWAREGILFTSNRPQGLVPGEGAAGLLLCEQGLAQAHAGSLFALLDPAEEALHAASNAVATSRQRAQPGMLGELAVGASRHGGAALADIALVVADTGQRQPSMLELMGMVSRSLPQLDDAEDVLCIGSASGHCGAVPFITAMALAQHTALVRAAPVLCIANEATPRRSVQLVRPAVA